MSRPLQKQSICRHRSMEDLPAVLKDTQKESVDVFVNLLRESCELESAPASLNSSVCEGGSNAETPVCHAEDAATRRLGARCTVTEVQVANRLTSSELVEASSSHSSSTTVNSASPTEANPPQPSAAAARPSSAGKRPSSLGLRLNPPAVVTPVECRVVQNCSGSSAPDPPMLLSPCADFVEAFASAQHDGSMQRGRSASSPRRLGGTNGFAGSRTARAQLTGPVVSLQCTATTTVSASPEGLTATATATYEVESIDAQIRSKRIAERLRRIGDDLDDKQIAQILQDLTSQISANPSPDPSQLVCTVQSLLASIRVQSWSAVGRFFRVGLKLLQQLTVLLGSKSQVSDIRWRIYINAIIQFLDDNVSPWISSQGGWEQLLKDQEQRLFTPAAAGDTPPHPHTSTTPPSLRPHSTTPAVNISSPPSLGSNNHASLWSLSESGSLVDEFGNEETNGTPRRTDSTHSQFTSDLEDSTRSSASEMDSIAGAPRLAGAQSYGGGIFFSGIETDDDESEDSVFTDSGHLYQQGGGALSRPLLSSSPDRQLCDSGIVSSLEIFSLTPPEVILVPSSHCQVTVSESTTESTTITAQQSSTPLLCQHRNTRPDLSSSSEPVLIPRNELSQSYENTTTCSIVSPCQQQRFQEASSSSSSSIAQVLASPFQNRRIPQNFQQQRPPRLPTNVNRPNSVSLSEGDEGLFDRGRSYSLPLDQIRRRSHDTRGRGQQGGAGGRGQTRQEADPRRMSAEEALIKFVYLSEKATQVYTILSDYMQK